MSDPIRPDDVRAMRQRILRASRGYERVDGKNPCGMPSSAANMTRSVLRSCEYAGWSGEDAMTALAYHALIEYERLYDMVLANVLLQVPSSFVFPPTPKKDPHE